jgi:hypothetical protein
VLSVDNSAIFLLVAVAFNPLICCVAFWHWVNYLQKKNPNVLALINKLQKPSERLSLNKPNHYWQTILMILFL